MTWTLGPSVVGLAVSAAVIVVAGTRLARTADTLADRTGLGDAVAGALLLGAVTSLPGIVTTATGALEGDASFALANPVGGVAIQTVWLAIADLVYRRANLEHAAASLENILQALLLVAMLAIPVIAYATPQMTLGWFHPATLAIPVLYAYGLVLLRQMHDRPMWRPISTQDTQADDAVPDGREDRHDGEGDEAGRRAATTGPIRAREQVDTRSTARLWVSLGSLGLVVGVTGWVIGQAGLGLVRMTGLPSDVVGFTVTTAITSLPELVTLIAAVRLGALTLGVGNIIGGNVFDTLMIAAADLFYLEGSVYASAGPSSLVLLGGTMLITVVLAAGLIMRERRGIGFEGLALPVLYGATVALAVVAL